MATSIAERIALRCGSYLSPQLLPVYDAIAHALGTALGLPWTLAETADLTDLTDDRLDLAFLCGAQYLLLTGERSSAVELLAAPVLRGRRYAGKPWYYSDVVVRADSSITAWADLRGARFGINEPGSHSGYAVVQEHLRQGGADWGYFGRVTPTGSHLASLAAVLAGEIDAAAIDSQIWDVYRQRHRTLSRRLRSVAMLGPSTVPPIVVNRRLPGSLVARLRAALVGLHEDPEMVQPLARGGIRRFVAVTPADYQPMREMWARNGLLPEARERRNERASLVMAQREDAAASPDLRTLGPGAGSKVEALKAASAGLRGDIDAQLAEPTPRFTEDAAQMLKFHGTYQQDDRDLRQRDHAHKAYQFMVRTRIPGGVLTAAQYLAHDAIAGDYANGTLRITTRQGLQMHGVIKADLHATIHAINETLLTTLAACGDVNRNVMTCPAPHADALHAAVGDLTRAIATHLTPHTHAYHEIWLDGTPLTANSDEAADEPIYGATYLPRKFKIGVALPGDNCIDVYTQDVGLVAEADDAGGVRGYTVLIGGGMGRTHGKTTTYPRLATPLCFATPAQVLPIVTAIVTIQRDYGDRANRKHARMKYLVAERGIAWFRAEVAERTGLTLAEPHPLTWDGADDHLGWHRQGDGTWSLGLFVENGRIQDVGELRLRSGLRAVMDRFAPSVRLTPQQNILLCDIPTGQKTAVRALLARYGVVVDPTAHGVRRFALACPALPTCGQAVAEAERVLPGLLTEISAVLDDLGLGAERLSIRMTGCPNGCARPYMGDIGVVGRSRDLYTIYVGGDWANTRLNQEYADDIPTEAIVPLLRQLFTRWRAERLPGEAFGDFWQRAGRCTST